MRTTRFLVVVLCAAGLSVSAALAGDSKKKLMNEVTALGDTPTKAMLSDDMETMLGMYAEDAISLPNYSPRMEGKEAFRKSHDEMAASRMKITSFTNDPINVWECGDQVTEIGVFAIELEIPGMPHAITDEGKYLTIYDRDAEGNLKVKVET